MAIGETVNSLVDILGSNQGTLSLAIAAAVAILTPFVDRLLIRRRRLQYRVLYNSKIGLNPISFEADDGPQPADPRLAQLSRLLDRMSVVIIRIRNTGSFDITPGDFDPPLSFTFGRRVVWDARVSDATTDQLRQRVRESLEFFGGPVEAPAAPPRPTDDQAKLPALRRWLAPRLSAWLNPTPVDVGSAPPQWHGVRLARLSLQRKESFKLVVVLREAGDHDAEISKEFGWRGGLTGGRIADEKRQRRYGWPIVVAAVGVALVGALVATLLVSADRSGGASQCASGTLALSGSSAFGPIVQRVGDEYHARCAATTVRTDSNGSLDGLRALAKLDHTQATGRAVLSDGLPKERMPALVQQPVALIVFGVVVNGAVGVDSLTLDQVRDIYAGRVTDWSQLRPGPALPIRIVGRGEGSGTRLAFETYLLGGASEGVLSSDGCLTRDRVATAPTIRCERGTTEDLVGKVADTPGAIGYADVANQVTKDQARGRQITPVKLDGRYPSPDSLPDYPFWTVEHVFSNGQPEPGSALRHFLDHLAGDTARTTLRDAGYTPCVDRDGVLNPLCGQR